MYANFGWVTAPMMGWFQKWTPFTFLIARRPWRFVALLLSPQRTLPTHSEMGLQC